MQVNDYPKQQKTIPLELEMCGLAINIATLVHLLKRIDFDYIIPQTRSGSNLNSRMVKRKTIQDISREIPMYTDPIYRPPPKPTEIPLQEITRKLMDLDMDINMEFKENSPNQADVISETYERPDKSHFQKPPELDSLINTDKLIQKFLLRQADIDKILK